jgi:hypothetical protein
LSSVLTKEIHSKLFLFQFNWFLGSVFKKSPMAQASVFERVVKYLRERPAQLNSGTDPACKGRLIFLVARMGKLDGMGLTEPCDRIYTGIGTACDDMLGIAKRITISNNIRPHDLCEMVIAKAQGYAKDMFTWREIDSIPGDNPAEPLLETPWMRLRRENTAYKAGPVVVCLTFENHCTNIADGVQSADMRFQTVLYGPLGRLSLISRFPELQSKFHDITL